MFGGRARSMRKPVGVGVIVAPPCAARFGASSNAASFAACGEALRRGDVCDDDGVGRAGAFELRGVLHGEHVPYRAPPLAQRIAARIGRREAFDFGG